MADSSNILQEHKKMLLMSGKISDFQSQNLLAWPRIVFDDVEDLKIKYDFTELGSDTIVPGFIEFDIKFAKGSKIKATEAKQKQKIISEWVQTLFWADTKVFFKRNGKDWVLK